MLSDFFPVVFQIFFHGLHTKDLSVSFVYVQSYVVLRGGPPFMAVALPYMYPYTFSPPEYYLVSP